MKRYFIILLCGLFLFPSATFANDEDSLGLPQLFPNKNLTGISKLIGLPKYTAQQPKKKWYKAMRFSGWARFYPYYRHFKNSYDMTAGNGLSFPVNLTADDGYLQPMMLLQMDANPSAKVSFTTQIQFNHFMLRNNIPHADTSGRLANLYVLFQFQANIDTRLGHLKLIAGGGVNWYRLSPSTLWQYQYRDDMFERYPWEPEGHDFSRYNSYYSVGDIPRDARFGMQATQGFIIEGTNMPGGFDAAILYGKTNTAGGFQSYLTKNPVNMIGGRIGKTLGEHKLGFNYFNQFGYTDSKVHYTPIAKGTDTFYVESNRMSQLVTTVDARLSFKKFSIFAEVGMGSYLDSAYGEGLKHGVKPGINNISKYKRAYGETMYMEISTKKSLTKIPLKIDLYRISKNVVNNSSNIYNTSVEQAKPSPTTPDQYYINYFDGMVTNNGQLANNRQGINIFAFKGDKKLKIKFDMGISQEIVNLAGDMRNGARANAVAGTGADSIGTKVPFTNSITYQHMCNGLTRSRFAFYQRFQGPYDRLQTIFRRAYENIAITDDVINYKKSFNTMDLELKYKIRFLGKELILSNFMNYSSVQATLSPVPVFTDKAFLRYFYEEFMTFYAIHPKITLVGFFGMERGLGNKRTELADANGNLITDSKGRPIADPNGKPINQTGFGYGAGFDYNFHPRASLHFRNRWFNFKDKNFTQDRYQGDEATMELKVFF